MPGVLGVFTGAELAAAGVKAMPTTPDFRRADGRKTVTPPRRALAHEFARYVGEAVVAVVAETREAARDAVESVVVEYEELPAVTDVARRDGRRRAPRVTADAPDNIAAEMRHGDAAAAEAAFARAARAGRARSRQPARRAGRRWSRAASSPRSTAASGRLDGAHQQPDADRGARRASPARCPTSRRTQVRVLVGDVGGGFGMKTGAYPEDIVVAHAARALGRPVRWQAERSEEFLSASHGRDVTQPRRARARRRRQGAGAARAARSPTSAPTRRRRAIAIQLLIGPWVSTSIYDIRDDRPAPAGGADQHDADRRRTAAPAGPRRSTSSSG